MPIKVNNTFQASTPVGAALGNAITNYVNNMPTYGEEQESLVTANKANSPAAIRRAAEAMYGSSGGEGQYLTPQMAQNALPQLAEGLAMGGNIGEMGALTRAFIANAANLQDPSMIDRAQQGAGQNYSSTETGFLLKEQNDMAKQQMRLDADMQRSQAANQAALERAQIMASANPQNLKFQQEQANQLKGKQDFDYIIKDIATKFDSLANLGAASDPKNNLAQNVYARAGNSEIGQVVGSYMGTKAQSIRNDLVSARQLLKPTLMKATGMSARMLDSIPEMKAFDKAIAAPVIDVPAALQGLARMSYLYGNGAFQYNPTGGGAQNPAGAAAPATAPAAPAVAPSGTGGVISLPEGAKADLLADPSPEAQRDFDEWYGAGASQQVLSAGGM